MSILLRPILTEKSTKLAEVGKFTFEVASHVAKGQVKAEVERVFGVSVKGVWTKKLEGKTRRFGRLTKKLPVKKHAIVKLKDGQTIDLFVTEKKGGKRKKK